MEITNRTTAVAVAQELGFNVVFVARQLAAAAEHGLTPADYLADASRAAEKETRR